MIFMTCKFCAQNGSIPTSRASPLSSDAESDVSRDRRALPEFLRKTKQSPGGEVQGEIGRASCRERV